MFDAKYPANAHIDIAEVISSNGTINIKGSNDSTLPFTIQPYETGTFYIKTNGIFSFNCNNINLFNLASITINGSAIGLGECDVIPDNFMAFMFYKSISLTSFTFSTASQWTGIKHIGNNFLNNTFYLSPIVATNLALFTGTAAQSFEYIGNNFLFQTFKGSSVRAVGSLLYAFPLLTYIGEYFLYETFMGSSIEIAHVLCTITNPSIDSIPNYLMNRTFVNCINISSLTVGVGITASTTPSPTITIGDNLMEEMCYGVHITNGAIPSIIVLFNKPLTKGINFMKDTFTNFVNTYAIKTVYLNDTNVFPATVSGLATNSMGFTTSNVTRLRVPTSLLTQYRASADWSNIPDSVFYGDT
jgi:hypothetical protein